MCYFVIAVKRGKKRDRAGVEQRPPPPPLFPIHATFSKFSQFEWCKINLFLQYSEEVHGLHCLSWKLFLQLGYCNIFFLFDQWAYYYYKNCGLSISWGIAFCTRLSPQKMAHLFISKRGGYIYFQALWYKDIRFQDKSRF